MIRYRIGETLASQQRRPDLCHHGAQPPDIGVAGQQFKGIVETGAGLEQQREVACESGDLGGARPAEQAVTSRTVGSPLLFDGFDGQEPQIFDPTRDLGGRRCTDRAVHDLAVLGQGAVAEIRHVVTAWS
jgi:hypothetical protein